MQIVIDISLEWLFDMKNKKFCQTDSLYQKILNGTPLPENHGRLIDADKLKKKAKPLAVNVYLSDIDNAPTIIKASE